MKKWLIFFVLSYLVGKKPVISTEIQHDEFELRLPAIVVDGKMVSSTNDIYLQLGSKLHMTKQAVYLAVKRYITSKHPTAINIKCNRDYDYEDKECDSDYVPSDENFFVSKNSIRFRIDIEGCVIFPTDKQIANNDWKMTLTEILWQFSRLPCAWTFDRLRVVCNEVNVSATCTCNKCSATLFAFTECSQSKLTIIIKSYCETIIHDKKVKLTNTKYRENILNMLEKDANVVVRAKLANACMNSDDHDPAHLPLLHTCQQMKHAAKKFGCLDNDPMKSLAKMKYHPEYVDTIGDIGYDPFYCIYATKLQQIWQQAEMRHRRCILSIDSTGTNTMLFILIHYWLGQ